MIGDVADRSPAGRLSIKRSRALGEIDRAVSGAVLVSQVSLSRACVFTRRSKSDSDKENTGMMPSKAAFNARERVIHTDESKDLFGVRRVDLEPYRRPPEVSLATYKQRPVPALR